MCAALPFSRSDPAEDPALPLEATTRSSLPKAATGISGFDDVTLGGLPAGRPSLVCGAAGCGKTLFAMSFLVNGAAHMNEPGLFVSFEERPADIEANVRSLGFDVPALIESGRLAIDYVHVERSEIEEAGEYDLEGLFVRLGFAVDAIGARRLVIDTIETLFSGFSNHAILRAELRRLFTWIRARGLTAIITGERGDGQLTRHGLEEYVSDCVILLDNRVDEQIATRRLRIVKYRGSSHATNEFPFLIDMDGISVLPVTGSGLHAQVSEETISSGIADLDRMIRNGGFYRASSILVSGVAGTGKTMLGTHFVAAACRRGERCIYFAFEENAEEIIRNARSVGIDLRASVASGLLMIECARPSLYGLEMHLARMHRALATFRPTVVVMDPISAFRGPGHEVHAAMLRMLDLLKAHGITAMFTSLRAGNDADHGADQGLSSLMDTWIRLSDIEANGERNRILYLIKSRGSSHSNQVREFRMTDDGIRLVEPYVGPEGVLTGAARMTQEAREFAARERRRQEVELRRRQLARRRESVTRQIEELRAAMEAEEAEARTLFDEDAAREAALLRDSAAIAARRGAAE